LPLPESAYHLNLDEHSGIIVGQTEKGILMSLLQIAHLAASHGWKVVLFDPSDTYAAAFVSTVQAAGCPKVYQFPSQLHLSDQGMLLRNSLSKMFVDSAYIGVNVWSQRSSACTLARLLLDSIMRNIWKQDAKILLLLTHPELLFEMEQILPLFAALEQNGGSLFVAARSIADFGWQGSTLVENARTVIAHRSNPSFRLTSCISGSWGQFFDKTVRSLPDNECIILHAGEATHVRVKSVDPEVPRWRDLKNSDEDYDALSAYLFGPGEPL
jgi:hypothetical protein